MLTIEGFPRAWSDNNTGRLPEELAKEVLRTVIATRKGVGGYKKAVIHVTDMVHALLSDRELSILAQAHRGVAGVLWDGELELKLSKLLDAYSVPDAQTMLAIEKGNTNLYNPTRSPKNIVANEGRFALAA